MEELGPVTRLFYSPYPVVIGSTAKSGNLIIEDVTDIQTIICCKYGGHVEIASAAGYSSRTSFNRNFKESTGFTPSEYLLRYHGTTVPDDDA